eukprot:scaffold3209_cov152-Amphora_coffeaeformis.AAC.5
MEDPIPASDPDIVDDMWDEDDNDDDDDDDDDYMDEDEHFQGGGAIGASLSSMVASDAGKKMNLSHAVKNSVAKMHGMETYKRTLTQGRDDRATSEQVLDPRTRLILFKFLSQGFFETIDGCLSTGKEANVYYAKAGKDSDGVLEYAVKIYKTSILVFKDRDKYVSGEHRWRKGYCKSNPRKMVKVWAEKEMRNYRRIHQAGIPCPRPVLLKTNILIMEFLGSEGWPSPRLKDATLSEKRLREAYVQCIMITRHLFQRCKLVHGDLSEYNLLWHNNQVYVIDVSQSVESDHPSALDFLRKDASNINDFFRKVGRLDVMSVRQLFEFVTANLGGEEEEMAALDRYMEQVDSNTEELAQLPETSRRVVQQQDEVDEAVFMSSFFPRSLNQMAEYEIEKLEAGEVEESYANAVATLTGNQVVADEEDDKAPTLVCHGEDEQAGEVSGDDESDEEDEEDSFKKLPKTLEELEAEKTELKAQRRANKKAVKEANTEKRKTKLKKKDKQRAIKKSKAGSKKNK